MVIRFLREHIRPLNPALLLYHKAVGFLAALVYGFPARKLRVIGVTGTHGKSTTVHLIGAILKAAGLRVGLMSTIAFEIAGVLQTNVTKQTMLGRFALQKMLRKMVREKCDYAVLEVTSQGLTQSRLYGVPVFAAVFLNLHRDHFDYHGGKIPYRNAKGLLFQKLANHKGVETISVLNKDDGEYAYFRGFTAGKYVTFSRKAGGFADEHDISVDVRGEILEELEAGSRIKISGREIDLHLPGEQNLENALAASSVAYALSVAPQFVKQGLESVAGVPGRFERIDEGQNFSVVVDYAHAPDALEKICFMLKKNTRKKKSDGRLILVFGAPGGGRDKTKRPIMGKIADQYCDEIVLTDDDPYTEDRLQIMHDLASGIQRTDGEHLWKILGRRKAMHMAFSLAREGDTVLIAGKGSEERQCIGYEKIPWDDRKVARELLREQIKMRL